MRLLCNACHGDELLGATAEASALEHYDGDAMISAFDDVEVAGVKEVKRIMVIPNAEVGRGPFNI